MWTSVGIFESGHGLVILLRNFVLFDLLRSYQSVPPNLAAGLDARRLFEKRKGGSRTLTSPRVMSNPLHLLGSGVSGDQNVWMESQSVVFVTGSAKSLDGIAIFPALSSNRNPQMGTLWARQGRAFEPVSLY